MSPMITQAADTFYKLRPYSFGMIILFALVSVIINLDKLQQEGAIAMQHKIWSRAINASLIIVFFPLIINVIGTLTYLPMYITGTSRSGDLFKMYLNQCEKISESFPSDLSYIIDGKALDKEEKAKKNDMNSSDSKTKSGSLSKIMNNLYTKFSEMAGYAKRTYGAFQNFGIKAVSSLIQIFSLLIIAFMGLCRMQVMGYLIAIAGIILPLLALYPLGDTAVLKFFKTYIWLSFWPYTVSQCFTLSIGEMTGGPGGDDFSYWRVIIGLAMLLVSSFGVIFCHKILSSLLDSALMNFITFPTSMRASRLFR